MLIDMTYSGFVAPNKFPLSGYKVAYFRIPQWDKVNEKNGLINGKPPVLEICLLPEEMDIKSFSNECGRAAKGELAFVIPPEALIIKVRAGDDWPDIQKIKEAMEKQKEQLRLAKEEADAEELEWFGEPLAIECKEEP